MPKLALNAKLTCDPEKAADFEAALAALVAAAEEEAGLEVYTVSRDQEQPGTYVFYELYTDAAAFEAHGKGENMKAAMGAIGALLSARPEVTKMDPVAGKGVAI